MKILILKCGRSSLKFQVIDMDGEKMLVKGNYESIGGKRANLRFKANGQKVELEKAARDYEEAVKWYKASAAKRCSKAEFNLYICYKKGTGVEKDMIEALSWLKKAAKHNDATAQVFLGEYYYNGIHVKKNRCYAERWFKKALENAYKNEVAVVLNDLGVKYYGGEYGFQKDKAMAIKCFEKAGELGLSLSIGWLIIIYIEDGNTERVEYWKKKYRKCIKKYRFITAIVNQKCNEFKQQKIIG